MYGRYLGASYLGALGTGSSKVETLMVFSHLGVPWGRQECVMIIRSEIARVPLSEYVVC